LQAALYNGISSIYYYYYDLPKYKPLRGAAFSSNFREQLSGAALNSFGETFYIRRIAAFGQLLWTAALASCPEHFSGTIALKNSSFRGQFYKQLRGAAFSSNFREQLSVAALQNSFGEPFGGIGLKSCSFGAIALDSNFW
jgi:hypothetical protein